jgi:phage repressor protein C with HTH and peptisase S24 domain
MINIVMKTKERLKIFVQSLNMGQNAFEAEVGIANGYLASKSQSVNSDAIEKIIAKYPNLNLDWLFTGSGSMFLDNNEKVIEPNGEGDSIKTLPRIPYDAAAGSLTDAVEGVTEYQCERIPVVAAFPKYDFTIRVSGRSMEPYYFSGDEVACLRINEARFIQWGRAHVLDTTQGVLIKRIYDNGDSIRCVSYNPEYADFNVPKEDIFSYNLVVGALRL